MSQTRRTSTDQDLLLPRNALLPNRPRTTILNYIKDEGYQIQPQLPLRPQPATKGARHLYCMYYIDHGHGTEDYRRLKDIIEKLTKQGHLRRFIMIGHFAKETIGERKEARSNNSNAQQ